MLIGIIGPPSAGKTTMSHFLRYAIDGSREVCSEYARHWIEKTERPPQTVFEQLIIHDGQIKWENQKLKSYDIVLSDSPVFLSFVYGSMLADKENKADQYVLSRLYELAIMEDAKRYDVLYLLPPRSIEKDGIRIQTDEDCTEIYNKIKNFMDENSIKYTMVPSRDHDQQASFVSSDLINNYNIKIRRVIANIKKMENECLPPESLLDTVNEGSGPQYNVKEVENSNHIKKGDSEEMIAIKFSGASDDLVEVDGPCWASGRGVINGEEFNAIREKDREFYITNCDGETYCKVWAIYDGCWCFAVNMVEEGHENFNPEIKITNSELNDYSTCLEIKIPEDLFVVQYRDLDEALVGNKIKPYV